MRTIPTAFAWQLWKQFGWVNTCIIAYILLLSAVCAALGPDTPVFVSVACTLLGSWAIVICLPANFAFSQIGTEMASPRSGYPPFMLRLPVSTRQLVGWPMALAAATSLILWLLVSQCIFYRALGISLPLWPGIVCAATLIWMQAIAWCSFPAVTLRNLAAVVAMGLILCSAIPGAMWKWNQALMAATYTAVCGLGYLAGCRGLSIARTGGGESFALRPRRAKPVGRDERIPDRTISQQPLKPFRSKSAAQTWLEWRHNCHMAQMFVISCQAVLVIVAIVFSVAVPGSSDGSFYFGGHFISPLEFLAASCLLLPFLLSMTGPTGLALGRCNARPKGFSLSPFWGVRPLRNAEIVNVKLRIAAAASVRNVCIGILSAGAIAALPSQWKAEFAFLQEQSHHFGAARLTGIAALICIGAIAFSWRQAIGGLAIGLTGRPWLAPATFGYVALFCLLVAFARYIPASLLVIRSHLIAVLLSALIVKTAFAVLSARLSLRRGDAKASDLLRYCLLWIALSAATFAALRCVLPGTIVGIVPLALMCAIFWPVGRLMLCPLALGWNRSR